MEVFLNLSLDQIQGEMNYSRENYNFDEKIEYDGSWPPYERFMEFRYHADFLQYCIRYAAACGLSSFTCEKIYPHEQQALLELGFDIERYPNGDYSISWD